MPRYNYECPDGHVFERVAGFDQDTAPCDCGQGACRQAVYADQFVTFKGAGFTKSVGIPASEVEETQDAQRKALTERGWRPGSGRTTEAMRKARVEDSEGRTRIDMDKIAAEG